MGVTCSKNPKVSTLKLDISSEEGAQSLASIPSRQTGGTEFSIFDGSSIPSDSPWSAFISKGIDDDYSDQEAVEIPKATFVAKDKDIDLHEDDGESAPLHRKSIGASRKDQEKSKCDTGIVAAMLSTALSAVMLQIILGILLSMILK